MIEFASGSARSAIVKAEGSSQIELDDLHAQSATVELKGSSSATVNAVGWLDVDLVGASKLTYSSPDTYSSTSDRLSRISAACSASGSRT